MFNFGVDMHHGATNSWRADESALLHALPTGVLVADATGRILFANARAASILGSEPALLGGARIDDHLAPVASLERLSQSEGRPRIEPPGRPDQTIGFRVSRFPLDSGVEAFAVVFQDITSMERRRREKDRLLQLAGMSEREDGLWLDLVWRKLAAQQAGAPAAEGDAAKVLGRLPHHVFARDENGRFILSDSAVAASYGLTADALEGLTEERRLAAAVEAAARDWRDTFDAMSAAMMVLDAQGNVLRANRTAAEWLAVPVAALPGRRFDEFTGREPWRRSAELVTQARRGSGGVGAEVRGTDSDAAWEIRVDPARAGDGTVILAVRDVTVTVEMRESARRNESLAALGSLMAGVAHEIRNPMTAIGMHVEALAFAMKSEGQQEEDESIVALRTEVKRLGQLLQELLEYGRPRSPRPEPVSLPEVMRSAVAACRDTATRAGVSLDTTDVTAPMIAGDAARLRRAFMNLIENAVQNTPAGGTVTAGLSVVDHGAARLIRCRVADSGPGFRPDDLDKVFEPFFTRRPGGIGLGLPIVRRIFWDHGASVEITNRPEGGALVLASFLVDDRA